LPGLNGSGAAAAVPSVTKRQPFVVSLGNLLLYMSACLSTRFLKKTAHGKSYWRDQIL